MNFLLQSLETELNAIVEVDANSKITAAIKICHDYLVKLKKYIDENSFKTIEDEIHFFKYIKPKFQSKLIFYLKWQDIQVRKIASDNEAIIKYFHKECRKLKRFLKENSIFHIYILSGQTHFDEKIFTRNNPDLVFYVEPLYIALDPS